MSQVCAESDISSEFATAESNCGSQGTELDTNDRFPGLAQTGSDRAQSPEHVDKSDCETRLSELAKSYVASELEYSINALFDLVPVLQSTADRILARRLQQLSAIHTAPGAIFINRIYQRYPQADPRIVQRLAKGAFKSYLGFMNIREGVLRDTEEQINDLHSGNGSVGTFKDRSAQRTTTFKDSGLPTSSWKSPLPHEPTKNALNTGPDRGLATWPPPYEPIPPFLRHRDVRKLQGQGQDSEVSASVYTVASPDAELLGWKGLRPPPLPTIQPGSPFCCPICKSTQAITSAAQWEYVLVYGVVEC